MPKGSPISEGQKEQAIALVSTSLNQEQIAKKVGVSRRSLARIWKNAGITRKSEKPPKGRKGARVLQVSGKEILHDSLQIARIREHSDYLREQLKYLAANIWVPAPASVLLWPGTKEKSYPRFESTAASSSSPTQRRPIFIHMKMSDGQIQTSLAIEKCEDWQFLKPHLAAEKSPDIIKDHYKWVLSLSQLFSKCHSLLLHMISEVDKRISGMMQHTLGWEGIKMVSGWGRRGVSKWFYEDIYYLILTQRESDKEEFSEKPVEGQPDLVGLFRWSKELTMGTTVEVNAYQNVHKSIRGEAAHWPRIKELLEIYKRCEDGAEALISKLNVIEKRGDFKGVCEICRPWHSLKH